jgi:hypothetical protein
MTPRVNWLRWLGFKPHEEFMMDTWVHPFFGRITYMDLLERWR